MGKNVNFVSHKKSKLKENGGPKLPLASDLVEGEIAINFAENVETLSIKNESGDVVTFSSDNYYTEKKLGSGFTGENSANTVTSVVGSGFTSSSITDVIIENEEIASAALTDLEERKLDASAYTPSVDLWVSGTGLNSVVQKGGGNTASGKLSVAMGSGTTASGNYSVAEGYNTTTNGFASHAEGEHTTASSIYSHAEGYYTTANGESSHAEGLWTSARGARSHAEGYYSTASGNSSHAEGSSTKSSGDYSHAEGYYSTASGYASHAEGRSTVASNQSEHASGQYNVSRSASTEFGDSGNTLFSVGNGTYGNNHNAFEIRQNGDIYISSGNSDIRLQDYIGSTITVDQVLDGTTSASTNPVSSKAVYDAVTENELVWTNAFVAMSGTVSAHTANTEIHVTAADKTAWNAKLDAADVEGLFGAVNYDSTSKRINFYNTSTGGTVLGYIDATDFIKDGMVQNVEIKDVTSGGSQVTCLVISFNTDAGKQDINIPLTDIFDASNYYTKSQTSGATEISNALTDLDARKLDASAYTPSVELWVSGTGLNSAVLKGSSGTASGDYSVAEGYRTSATSEDSHAEGSSTVASGYASHAEGGTTQASGDYSHAEGVGTTASGYYSHAEGNATEANGDSSHAEGISTVANGYTSHAEGDSTVANGESSHAEGYGTVASGDYSHAEGSNTTTNNISEHASGQYNVSNSASTEFGDSGNTLFSVGNGTADDTRHNAFEIRQNGDIYITSGNSEIKLQDSLGGSVETVTAITPSNSGSTDPIATKVVAENELAVSAALNDLDERKLDASAYTPTDLSNYYTKSQTSGATEISNALTSLDTRKLDTTAYTPSVDLWVSGTGLNSVVLKDGGDIASGKLSVAMGSGTTASGNYSVAEGNSTTASGNYSHTEGSNTIAKGDDSHAEGYLTTASGDSSHAEGYSTTANGLFSHAEGDHTTASGARSHAEGQRTTASGEYSHAEGYGTTASGNDSHAEGYGTTASGTSSHAEGRNTTASSYSSHAEGSGTTASGDSSHAEGQRTTASGTSSHAEGRSTEARGHYSHAEGNGTEANGDSSHAEGYITKASGLYSHAEGSGTKASGTTSHAEGNYTTANGINSHAEGYETSATSYQAHAEGVHTKASGNNSHAEGSNTIAKGDDSHAEGWNTTANGDSSHAEGLSTTANGNYSHAEGSGTTTNNISEHASGQFNISSSASTTFGNSGNTLFSVGNGTADNARHNAFEIRQNGDIYITSGGTTSSESIKLQDSIESKADKSDLGGLKLVKVTQAEYDALTTKDPNTLYVIVN